MSSNQSPPGMLSEIAELFASCPQPSDILSFRLSDASERRASELLQLNKVRELTPGEQRELEQVETVELLMRLVKARIRASQSSRTTDSGKFGRMS